MMKTQTYINALKNNRQRLLNYVGFCVTVAIGAYFFLPKSYKISTQIALQTSYFQLPLVSGFMSESHEAQELKAKREALIHLALNQRFLTRLAEQYRLVKNPKNTHEIEELSKKFEIIPNGSSAFIVNFTGQDPQVSYRVLQDFVAHLQEVMTDERKTLLLNLHEAIREQLESISISKPGDAQNTMYFSRPDLVQRRIEKIQKEIEILKNSYSESHPRIATLKDQLAQLSQWKKPYGEESLNSPHADVFSGMQVDTNSKELFDDFIKKYRYLEVVIYMDQQSKDKYVSFIKEPFVPKSATWPKLPILLVWGVALGFFLGAISILLKSLSQSSDPYLSMVDTPLGSPIGEKS